MIGLKKHFLFALLGDGASDRVLIPIIRWAIRQLDPNVVLAPPLFKQRGSDDIRQAVGHFTEAYRPNLVLVHRDAERLDHATRKREIPKLDGLVPLVPVRMTEAWLLTDESAIRRASGNPNGRVSLDMPPLNKLEHISDPKIELYRLLRTASELSGRRLRRLGEARAVHRVAESTEDFHALRNLPAFVEFERDLAYAYPIARGLPLG